MKHLVLLVLVAVAGGVLATIALNAPERAYRDVGALPPGRAVPTVLSTDVPAGYVTRVLDVENMCQACCPPAVFETLVAEHAVLEAAVDMDHGTASVIVPQDFDATRLADALAAKSYPAVVRP